MEFETLENMDKSEFLPLGAVKQEMLDTGNGISIGANATKTVAENNEINSATTNNTSDSVEVNNPVCDSVEKQVRIKEMQNHFLQQLFFQSRTFVRSL